MSAPAAAGGGAPAPEGPQESLAQAFKLVLVGEGEVGKTAWVAALEGRPIPDKYLPTLGAAIAPLVFHANGKPTRFIINAWDTAGVERFAGLPGFFYASGSMAVIAYDSAQVATYRKTRQWVEKMEQACGRVPMCVVGMKAEGGEDCRLLPAAQRTTAFLEARGIPVLTLDARSGRGLLAPIEYLLRQACQDDALTVSCPAAQSRRPEGEPVPDMEE